MGSARETIKGLLAQAMRSAMHDPRPLRLQQMRKAAKQAWDDYYWRLEHGARGEAEVTDESASGAHMGVDRAMEHDPQEFPDVEIFTRPGELGRRRGYDDGVFDPFLVRKRGT